MVWEEIWQDCKFLGRFFLYFSPTERLGISQVCQKWREVLYQPIFWREVRPVLHCRTIRSWSTGSSSSASSPPAFCASRALRPAALLALPAPMSLCGTISSSKTAQASALHLARLEDRLSLALGLLCLRLAGFSPLCQRAKMATAPCKAP